MTKQIAVSIPQTVYERARKLASWRNQEVAELFAEALTLMEQPPALQAELQMAEEENVFRAMRDQLIADYAHEYVAIYQGKLIDHDPDQLALLRRIDTLHPKDVVLLRKVLPTPEPNLRYRSSRLIRD